MKLSGTIQRSDLAGGHWIFKTHGGEQYQLSGSITGAKDGLEAELEGTVDKQAMGIGMTGPTFVVSKLTAK
jgi:hypothetical protein